MKPIYLDYAAATPVEPAVYAAMQPFFLEQFYNPSALYSMAVSVHRQLESARASASQVIGARPVEVTFVAGGTEANNLAIHGVMRQYPEANIIVSSIEHESVLEPAHAYDCREAVVNGQGIIDIEALKGQIDDGTVLISAMYANNEIGTVQPLREIAALIGTVREDRRVRGVELPLYLHSDAAQAGNYLDIHVSRLGVDLLTLNGGKIYGPKQSGILYVKSGLQLQPQILGGGQERGLRSGTENVAGAVGFAVALELAQQKRGDEVRRLQELQKTFIDRLQQALPAVRINGSLKKRLPNNLHVTIPGTDNERLLFGLDECGIMASAGSACSASSDEPSHVLRALGLSDAEARSSLRFSMGRATDAAAVERTVQALSRLAGTQV